MRKKLLSALLLLTLAGCELMSYPYATAYAEEEIQGDLTAENTATINEYKEESGETSVSSDPGDTVSSDPSEISENSNDRGGFSDPQITEDASNLEISSESNELNDKEEDSYHIIRTDTLTVSYDDLLDLKTMYEHPTVLQSEDMTVDSYQVENGEALDVNDTSILTALPDATYEVTGVGTCRLLIQADVEAETDTENTETVTEDRASAATENHEQKDASIPDVIELLITAEAAPITVFFLAGQSNMEGKCSAAAGCHPEDSIVCDAHTVYSTYGPSTTSAGSLITGLTISNSLTAGNASSFVAESLTSDISLAGSTLEYGLDELSESGAGKCGPDSGIAYTWNQLTGDKVWVINAAHSGSMISSWIPGAANYEKAYALFAGCKDTLDAEILAGHYTLNKSILIWMQGENDSHSGTAATYYLDSYSKMYEGLNALLSFDCVGLVPTRSSLNTYTDIDDVLITPVRASQSYICSSDLYPSTYMVGAVCENWISDSAVKTHFKTEYPDGILTYPTRNTLAIPTSVLEVHSDIHYTQIAHNENGLHIAKDLYSILDGSASDNQIQFYSEGNLATSSTIISKGQSATFVPKVKSGAMISPLHFDYDPDIISYDETTGVITGLSVGKTALLALNTSDEVVAKLTVTVPSLMAPTLQSVSNSTSGITLSWSKIYHSTGYIIYKKTTGKWVQVAKIKDKNTLSYTDTKAIVGHTYLYAVRAYNSSEKSGVFFKNIRRLSSPSLTTLRQSASIKLSWKADSAASGYTVYRRESGGSYATIASLSPDTTTFTDKTVAHGVKYQYKVTKKSANYTISSSSDVIYFLKQGVVKSVNSSTKKTAVVRWKSDTAVTGYQIKYVYGSKKKIITVKDKTKAYLKIQKLTSKKQYTVYLRYYKKIGKKIYYSAWSSASKVKIK